MKIHLILLIKLVYMSTCVLNSPSEPSIGFEISKGDKNLDALFAATARRKRNMPNIKEKFPDYHMLDDDIHTSTLDYSDGYEVDDYTDYDDIDEQLTEEEARKIKQLTEATDANRVKRRIAKNQYAQIPESDTDRDGPRIRERPNHYTYPIPIRDKFADFLTTPKDFNKVIPEDMNAGVVFRVRMSDAVLRIKRRLYIDLEEHIEGDIIYVNLIKKVVIDEINKFHSFLLMYETDKSLKEHVGVCGGRIYKFISYMPIKVNVYCLFDSLWIDGVPYVIGDDYSVSPLEIPPMLQCDASECNTVVFIDSLGDPKDQ